jgi:hypothetical protein
LRERERESESLAEREREREKERCKYYIREKYAMTDVAVESAAWPNSIDKGSHYQ